MNVHRVLIFAALLCLLSAPLRADLEVNVRDDKVILKDGTELACIIVMVTPAGVLIVETDPDDETKTRQHVIATNNVQKIIRGEENGEIAGLQTNTELARKVIQGSGFRAEEKDKKTAGAGRESKARTAKKGSAPETVDEPESAVAKAKTKSAHPDIEPPVIESTVPENIRDLPGLPAQVASVAGPSRFSGRDLAAAYTARFSDLQFFARQWASPDELAQLFEQSKQDQQVREQLEVVLKPLVGEDTSILGERKAFAPQSQKRPPKRRRPRNANDVE